MKLISFAWTTSALLAGAKTCTRRDWNPAYAKSFHAGELVQAWDKLPRAGGKRVGTIRLISAPSLSSDYPSEDYFNEGLSWMHSNGLMIQGITPLAFWEVWKREKKPLWVVRFAVHVGETKTGG